MGFINKDGPLRAIYDLVAFGKDSRFYDADLDGGSSRLHKIKAIERAHTSAKKAIVDPAPKTEGRNLPVVVGPRPRRPKAERLTDPAYPRPHAIILRRDDGQSGQLMRVTLAVHFNKSRAECDYIQSCLHKYGVAVLETYPNKQVAETNAGRVNEFLADWGSPTLDLSLHKY
jgi:ATP-dependent Clp protease adapter protein ClpS